MSLYNFLVNRCIHDDVIKWRHFLRYWPFMRGIYWSPVNSHTRSVTRSFDVFFNQRLNKRLRKQLWDWWYETPSRPLLRHCKDFVNNESRGTSRTSRAMGLPITHEWWSQWVAPCWVNSMGLNWPLTSDFLHLFFTKMLTHFWSSKSS